MSYVLLLIFVVIVVSIEIQNNKIRHPKEIEDDIEDISKVAYLIKDDNSYVMYKLQSAFNSKYLKSWTFDKKSDTEGEIVFGGPNFPTNSKGDKDFGFTYSVKIEPQGDNTLLYLKYIGRKRFGTMEPSKLLNQTYNFFIKELFDVVQVISAKDR